ncbi:Aldehyde dehydrogenase PuuC [Cedecea neteri]|uniref:Aldehyde dehydrogenase PuuC n=1 Tax=Cedecea neteri TaxID=158822 RepID=A0A2X3J6T7_9ENTR|nr:Aldehyde dehydrogenase PuuC [Cedecea neteri]
MRPWPKKRALPDGVFNVVTGFGHEAGQALAQHPDVDVITFTGSTRTGKTAGWKDAGDSNMKRVWLEAGGKSANIVFADCPDLQKAAATPPPAFSITRARSASPGLACCWKKASPTSLLPC